MQTLMTTKQVAEMIGFSHRTLAKWRQEGRGPKYIKIGSSVRYTIEDVEEWSLKRKRYSSTSDATVRG